MRTGLVEAGRVTTGCRPRRVDDELHGWESLAVHCSLWRFEGDPDDLERRYLDMLAGIPESNHELHAAAKTSSGLLIFDTCPSEEVFRGFVQGPVRELLAAHGLTPVSVEDFPVSAAYAQGARIDVE